MFTLRLYTEHSNVRHEGNVNLTSLSETGLSGLNCMYVVHSLYMHSVCTWTSRCIHYNVHPSGAEVLPGQLLPGTSSLN